MGYVGLAIRVTASACVAMLALSMLPPYWTYRSLAGLGVILLWAALKVAGDLPREPRTGPETSRAKRTSQLDASHKLAIRRSQPITERDAFGQPVPPSR